MTHEPKTELSTGGTLYSHVVEAQAAGTHNAHLMTACRYCAARFCKKHWDISYLLFYLDINTKHEWIVS